MNRLQRLVLAFLLLCLPAQAFARGGGSWSSWARRYWIPRDIPGNSLVAEFDASKGVTLNSTTVSSWADQTGNGHTLSAAGSAQPTYTASGINSTPELLFDGSANVMTTGAFTLNQPETVISVFASVTYGTGGVHDILWDGVAAGRMVCGSLTNASTGGSAGAAASIAFAVPNGTLTRGIFQYNGASSLIDIIDSGGTVRNSGAVNFGSNNGGGIVLGALTGPSRFYNAKVKYWAVYSTAVATVDLNSLKEWAHQRFLLPH